MDPHAEEDRRRKQHDRRHGRQLIRAPSQVGAHTQDTRVRRRIVDPGVARDLGERVAEGHTNEPRERLPPALRLKPPRASRRSQDGAGLYSEYAIESPRQSQVICEYLLRNYHVAQSPYVPSLLRFPGTPALQVRAFARIQALARSLLIPSHV
jgi:hypothetical protein